MTSKSIKSVNTPILSGSTLGDFWAWAYSDLLNNRNRSVLAEFIVATALGVANSPRVEWADCDLHYRNKKIEVKSSAYVQSWYQARPSVIRFDTAQKLAWDPETNITTTTSARNADCYVFCLLKSSVADEMVVLDIEQWAFYVILTGELEHTIGTQKSIGLKTLERLCSPVDFASLKDRVDQILGV